MAWTGPSNQQVAVGANATFTASYSGAQAGDEYFWEVALTDPNNASPFWMDASTLNSDYVSGQGTSTLVLNYSSGLHNYITVTEPTFHARIRVTLKQSSTTISTSSEARLSEGTGSSGGGGSGGSTTSSWTGPADIVSAEINKFATFTAKYSGAQAGDIYVWQAKFSDNFIDVFIGDQSSPPTDGYVAGQGTDTLVWKMTSGLSNYLLNSGGMAQFRVQLKRNGTAIAESTHSSLTSDGGSTTTGWIQPPATVNIAAVGDTAAISAAYLPSPPDGYAYNWQKKAGSYPWFPFLTSDGDEIAIAGSHLTESLRYRYTSNNSSFFTNEGITSVQFRLAIVPIAEKDNSTQTPLYISDPATITFGTSSGGGGSPSGGSSGGLTVTAVETTPASGLEQYAIFDVTYTGGDANVTYQWQIDDNTSAGETYSDLSPDEYVFIGSTTSQLQIKLNQPVINNGPIKVRAKVTWNGTDYFSTGVPMTGSDATIIVLPNDNNPRVTDNVDQRLNGVQYRFDYYDYEPISPFNNLYTVTVIGWTGGADTSGQNVVIADYIGSSTIQNGRLWPVRKVESNAFNGAGATAANEWQSPIKSIHIPDTITNIGNDAFRLGNLNKITGMKNVVNIGSQAFLGTQLTEITFYNLGNFGSNMFDFNFSLSKIYLLINQNAQYVIDNFRSKNVITANAGAMYYGDESENYINETRITFYKLPTADAPLTSDWNTGIFQTNRTSHYLETYVVGPTNINATVSSQAKSNVLADAAQVSVTYSGVTDATVQWQVSIDSGITWADIVGATSATNQAIQYLAAYNGSTVQVKAVLTYNGSTYDSGVVTLAQPPYNIVASETAVAYDIGSNSAFSVSYSGETGATIQWKKSINSGPWEDIDGATLTTATLAYPSGGAQVKAVITYLSVEQESNVLTLTPPTLEITVQPESQVVNHNGSVTFTAGAKGGSFTFQWYKVGTTDALDSGSTYTINNITKADAGSYYFIATSGSTVLTSSNATLNVNAAITAPLEDTTIGVAADNTSTYLTNFAHVGEIYFVQWQRKAIGADNSTYAITTDVAAYPLVGGYTYRALVIGYGMPVEGVYSKELTVYVLQSPTGVQAAQTKYVMSDDSITLSTNVIGSGLTYEWSYDQATEFGSNTPTKTITVDPTMFGKSYSVIVTNMFDSRSTLQVFNIVESLRITAEPQSQDIPFGSSKTLSVTALKGDSAATITYQWYKGSDAISGANSASYIATEDGSYHVRVGLQGTSVSVDSAIATLTSVLGIASQPPATFNIRSGTASVIPGPVAGGDADITYTWYKQDVEVRAASDVSGLTLEYVNNLTSGIYYCIVKSTNNPDGITSSTTIVHITAVITEQPTPATVEKSVSKADAVVDHTFTVGASGEKIAFQWYKKPVAAADTAYAPIYGARDSFYNLPALAVSDAGVYRVKIMDEFAPSFFSNTQALRIQPTIMTQPIVQTVAFNAPATFTVDASGEETLTYQWYGPAGTALANGSGISGVTTNALVVAATNISRAGNYYVVVGKSGLSSVTSSNARLNISPTITAQPGTIVRVYGGDATFTADASGEGLTYQWYKGSVAEANKVPVASATTKSLQLTNVQVADAGAYVFEVKGTYTPAVTATATLKVGPKILAPAVAGGSKFVGESFTFSVTASGEALTYKWFKDVNGNTVILNAIPGSNSVTTSTQTDDVQKGTSYQLMINPIATVDAGIYYVEVYGTDGSTKAISTPVRLNVKANLVENIVGVTVAEGSDSSIFFKIQGERISQTFPHYSYIWYKNGQPIFNWTMQPNSDYQIYTQSDTGSTITYGLIVRGGTVSDAGMYKVEVWNTYNENEKVMSNEVRLNIKPRITTNLSDIAAYVGQQNVALTVAANGETPISFKWRNGVSTPLSNAWSINSSSSNGAGTSTITLGRGFSVLDVSNTYAVDVSNAYGTVASNAIWIRPKATLKEHLAFSGTTFGSASGTVPYIVQYGIAPTAKLTLDTYYHSIAQANVVYYTEDVPATETSLFVDTTSFVGQSSYLTRFTLNLTAAHINTLANASANGTKKVHVRVYVNDTYTNPYPGDKTQFSDVLIDFAAAFTGVSNDMRPGIGSGASLTYDWTGINGAVPAAYTFYKGTKEGTNFSPITIDDVKYVVSIRTSSQLRLIINNITMSDIGTYYATISNGKIPTGAVNADVTGTSRNLRIIPTGGTVTFTQTPLFIGDDFTLTYTGVSGEMPMEYRYYNQANTQVSNPFNPYQPNTTEYSGLRKTTSDRVVSLVQPINDAYQEYGHAVFNEWMPYTPGLTVPVAKARVATLAYWPDSTGTKKYGNNVKTSATPNVVYFDVNSGTSTTTIPGLSGSDGKSIIKLQSNPGVTNIKWQRAIGSTDGQGSWVDVTNTSVGFVGTLASFPTAEVQSTSAVDNTILTNYALPAFTVNANTAGAYRMVMTQTRGHNGMYLNSTFVGPTLCFRIIPIIQTPLPPVLNLVKVGDVASFTIRATNMSNIIWKRVKNGASETIVEQIGTNVGVGNRYTNSVSGLVGTLSFVVQDGDEGYTYYAHPANPAAPTGVPNTAGTEFHIPASVKAFGPNEINKFIGEFGEFVVEIYGAKEEVRYQWKKNGENFAGWTTAERLTFPQIAFSDSGLYSVVVENKYTAQYKAQFGGIEQKSLDKILKIKSAIVSHNIYDRKLIVGTPLTLKVVGEGATLSYKWFKDGAEMSGKTASTLSVNATGNYRCEVTSDGNTSASPEAFIKFASLTDGAEAFEAILAGNVFPSIPYSFSYNEHNFLLMKKPIQNNIVLFNPPGAPPIKAELANIESAASMLIMVDENIADDGINKSIMTYLELFDSEGVKISNTLPAGSNVKMTWPLPADFDISVENLAVQRMASNETTVLQTIPLTRNADGTFSSVHTGFSPNKITTQILPCFPAGTRVLTAAGYKAVEELSAEDKMITADGRMVAFNRYSTHIAKTTAATAPYEIAAGAFGRSSPAAAVRLSPLHAIQSRKGVWQIPKYATLSNAGVKQYGIGESITYYHIELPNFFTDNIVAEGGAVVESFANKQAKGLKNVYKYNTTLCGFTRVSAKDAKVTATKK